MKTPLMLFAASLAAATLLAGPAPAAPNFAAQRQQALQRARLAIVDQKLALSDAQKSQAQQIRQAAAGSIQAIRANPALPPEQKRPQIAGATKASREQWRALLTAEQRTKLAQITSHPRELDALARQRVRAALIMHRLGLTAEQVAKVRALRAQAAAAARPVRADATLTAEQKTARLRAIAQANRGEIQAVLTPAQRARLAQIRQRLLAPLGAFGS